MGRLVGEHWITSDVTNRENMRISCFLLFVTDDKASVVDHDIGVF